MIETSLHHVISPISTSFIAFRYSVHFKKDGYEIQSVNIFWYEAKNRSSIPGRGKDIFSTASRRALGPSHARIQWASGALFPERSVVGALSVHSPYLIPRSRMVGLHLHFPYTSAWRGASLSARTAFPYVTSMQTSL
jgi:hypothetical protein